ncbi:GNAT family N-acetyltransferase [Halorarius halobius]|uniref:GNAT family N-acetyltransferase n=1 Tax=Halorarius halobius TaxID=2962671 RepID=UPI0020CC2E69|nr:GNAT family N-acetyltransferase [Halorarius halobius]
MDLLPLAPETPHFRAATDLYGEVQGGDPGASRDRFERDAGRRDYRGFVGVEDGRVVGYVYGHASQVGQPYHDQLRETLPADVYEQWLPGGFELAELGVADDRRREGLGSELLGELLGGVDRGRAVLTTAADATAARAFYEHHDWTQVHGPFDVDDAEVTLYGRRL